MTTNVTGQQAHKRKDNLMARYKADNDKIIDTDNLEHILEMGHKGQYGRVNCDLYRAKLSNNWYMVSESTWAGDGNISRAELVSHIDAARDIMRVCPEDKDKYPELQDSYPQVSDE